MTPQERMDFLHLTVIPTGIGLFAGAALLIAAALSLL
jgi:hypothetical protein